VKAAKSRSNDRNGDGRYLQVPYHDTVAGLAELATEQGLAVVAVDNTPATQRLESSELPRVTRTMHAWFHQRAALSGAR